MGLTKEQLLAAPRAQRTVLVPHLGEVTLRAPTAGEYLDYQRWLRGLEEDSFEHVTRIVALTAIDGEGKPLLTEEDCRNLPHSVLVFLSQEALALTKLTDEKVDAAKGES